MKFSANLVPCLCALSLLASCAGPSPHTKVLLGAGLFDTATRGVVDRAVVIVMGSHFKAVGDQPTLPIPPGSEKDDLSGRFLIPAPVKLGAMSYDPRFRTEAQLRALIGARRKLVKGMPADVAQISPDLIEALRAHGVTVFPTLTLLETEPHHLQQAKQQVKALFDAGVKLGVDGAASAHREWKFLSEAGLPAAAIIQASTLHAVQNGGGAGRIQAGAPANLYVLKCDPREDIACLVKIERAMREGEWVQPPALGEN